MKLLVSLLAVGLAVTSIAQSPQPASSQPAPEHARSTGKVVAPPSATAAAEQELIRLEHAWARAYVARDLGTLDRIEHADWACTDAEGKVTTKAEEHRDVSSGTYAATVFAMSDLKVRVYGDAAVVTGRQVEQATMAGKDASAEFRITDTWIRRDGRWQCVATHLSKVPKS